MCIIKFKSLEGDAVNPGDVLCDVQTDKAVVSFDIEEEGILAKILVIHCWLLNYFSTCTIFMSVL